MHGTFLFDGSRKRVKLAGFPFSLDFIVIRPRLGVWLFFGDHQNETSISKSQKIAFLVQWATILNFEADGKPHPAPWAQPHLTCRFFYIIFFLVWLFFDSCLRDHPGRGPAIVSWLMLFFIFCFFYLGAQLKIFITFSISGIGCWNFTNRRKIASAIDPP